MPDKRKNKINHVIMERDEKILKLLWKWKLVSSYAIAYKYFSSIQPVSAYRRLSFLAQAGFIKLVTIGPIYSGAWTLTDKGFRHIRGSLGELDSIGYKSEHPEHDCLVTAFHLGEWLTRQPEATQTFSEQQLRRIPMELWPSWVPKSDRHRPDGYSIFFHSDTPKVIAFETELWVKKKVLYDSVATFYNSQTTIDFVFWLVKSKGNANSLIKALKQSGVNTLTKHHFILLEDFQKDGWDTPVFRDGSSVVRIRDYLKSTPIISPSYRHHSYDALALLDLRKRPIDTKPYKILEKPPVAV